MSCHWIRIAKDVIVLEPFLGKTNKQDKHKHPLVRDEGMYHIPAQEAIWSCFYYNGEHDCFSCEEMADLKTMRTVKRRAKHEKKTLDFDIS